MKYVLNKIRNRAKFILCAVIFTSFCSCSLDIKQENEYSDPYAIVDVLSAREFLSSIYKSYPHYEYEFSVLSDDFVPTMHINSDGNLRNFYLWTQTSLIDFADDLWEEYYHTIALSNVLQERLDLITVANAEQHSQLQAIRSESALLKAMAYFDLLQIFCDTYQKGVEQRGIIFKNSINLEYPKRATIEKSLAEIERIIDDAVNKDWNAANGSQYWLSHQAAHFLKAQVALYKQDYKSVVDQCGAVKGKFSDTGYASLWKEDMSSSERIFGYETSTSKFYKSMEYSSTESYFSISKDINFGSNDIRAKYSQFDMTIEDYFGNEYPITALGKYYLMNKNGETIRYINSMTLEHLLFLEVEALYYINPEEAFLKLNDYVVLRGCEPLDNTKNLLTQILEQKQKALVGEGVRYFDLKRNRDTTLERYAIWGSTVMQTIRANDYRWTLPIPASEYRYNENVEQNDGWPTI